MVKMQSVSEITIFRPKFDGKKFLEKIWAKYVIFFTEFLVLGQKSLWRENSFPHGGISK